jgi:hypothetical protein
MIFIMTIYKSQAIEKLMSVVEVYTLAVGRAESTVSLDVFGTGDTLKRLRLGKDMLTERIESAMLWFYEHWPDNACWPDNVPIPKKDEINSNPMELIK